MMKRLLALGISLGLMMGIGFTTQAAGSNPSVNYTAKGELVYEGVSNGDSSTVDLGDAFKDIAPGEERTLTIDLKNNNNQTVDFYMSTDTMQSLEKSVANALGAGYEVKLTAGKQVLYDSKVGGYASETAAGSKDGLDAISDELKNMVLVGTLAKGETSPVKMTVYFDGEGMDNSKVADYTLSDGTIQFDFMVGYEEPSTKSEKKKIVTIKKEPIVINIIDEVTPLAVVKTGDTAKIGVAVLIILAGAVLILTGRKKKGSKVVRAIAPMILALGLAGAMGTTSMAAEDVSTTKVKTYTVTYRPGNVGQFQAVSDTALTKQEAALAYAKAFYKVDDENTRDENRTGISEIKATENGAIKLTVAKGYPVPAAPASIVADAGYKAALSSNWGPAADEKVTQNVDFVVDYVKLVDGVEYTIKFVDTVGNSVATDVIAYDNRGETVSYKAPVNLVLSGGAVYQLQTDRSAQTQSITLGDADKNVITYVYSYVPGATITVTEYEYEDGGIIYNHVPGTRTTVVNPTEVTVLPNDNNPGNDQNNPNNQQNAEENNGENGENGETVIPENETPLDEGGETSEEEVVNPGEEENSFGDETVIPEEEPPLSDQIMANLPYAIAAAALLLVAGSLVVLRRKASLAAVAGAEDSSEESGTDSEE